MPIKVEVGGIVEELAKLENFTFKASSLSGAFSRIGAAIAGTAKASTPVLTGRLMTSVRAGKAKAKATVRAGTGRLPYAGVIHFGWPKHNIEPNPFLTDALAANEDTAVNEIQKDLDNIIASLNLN